MNDVQAAQNQGHVFACIWDAIETDPARAAVLRMRSRMLIQLQEHFAAREMDAKAIAQATGVQQRHAADLVAGRLQRFSSERLIDIAKRAGLEVAVRFVESGQDSDAH